MYFLTWKISILKLRIVLKCLVIHCIGTLDKNLSWLHQNICLFRGNGINVSVWERWRITKRKENIQSFQLVSIYFLLAIHNTAIWNVTFDQGKSEAISSALSLTSGLLQYSAWISASGPWIEWFLFLGMMVYASILEKQKRTWYHAGPYGAPEHNFLCPSFLWLQETAFIQPLWPPLSSSGQIHAVVN